MEYGIIFEIGTTNFDRSVRLCELAFDEPHTFQNDWNKVKTSRDFKEMSIFLRTHGIKNDTFKII